MLLDIYLFYMPILYKNKKKPLGGLGRPRQRWSDRRVPISKPEVYNIEVENPEEMEKDKGRWKEVKVVAKSLNGLC